MAGWADVKGPPGDEGESGARESRLKLWMRVTGSIVKSPGCERARAGDELLVDGVLALVLMAIILVMGQAVNSVPSTVTEAGCVVVTRILLN